MKKCWFRKMIRGVAGVLAGVTMLQAMPMGANAGGTTFNGKEWEEGKSGEDYTYVTFYKWHRIYNKSTFPEKKNDYPLLLVWWRADRKLYAYGYSNGNILGTTYDGKSPYYPDILDTEVGNTDTFYTSERRTSLGIRTQDDYDGDNGNAQECLIFPDSDHILKGDGSFTTESGHDHKSMTNWTIYTPDCGDKFKVDGNKLTMQIFMNTSWASDTGFHKSGDNIYGWKDSTYDYDQFMAYYATTETFTKIKDGTRIAKGSVLNADDGVILMGGDTLYIEPGGILSIEGQFFNNGTIENHGTIILQKGACICPFDPHHSTSGRIINTGGLVTEGVTDLESKLGAVKGKRDDVQGQIDSLNKAVTEIAEAATAAEEELKKLKDDKDLQQKIKNAREALDLANEAYEKAMAAQKEYLDANPQATVDNDPAYAALAATTQVAQVNYISASTVYTTTYQPIADQEDIIQSAEDKKTAAEEQIPPLQEKINDYNEQIKLLEADIEQAKKKGAKTYRGEGNLFIMENAKLVLPDYFGSVELTDGASCFVGGYLISGQPMTVSDSKLYVRKQGAVWLGYSFLSNASNLKDLEVINPGSDDIDFAGLSASRGSCRAFVLSGDYYIENYGYVKYSSNLSINDGNPLTDDDKKKFIGTGKFISHSGD